MQRFLSVLTALILAAGLGLWMLTGDLVISGSGSGSSTKKLALGELCDNKLAGTLKKSETNGFERTFLSLFCKAPKVAQISEPFKDLCEMHGSEDFDIDTITKVEQEALTNICEQPEISVTADYQPEEKIEKASKGSFQVQVQMVSARDRNSVLTVRGKTEAKARIAIRSETTGVVEKIHFEKGQIVAAGDLLCTIEAGARQSQFTQAEANVTQAEFDYNNAKTLFEKGHTTQTRVQQLRAAYDAALAQIKTAELELERLNVHSKVGGIIDDPSVEPGDLLSAGGTCATIVQSDPLLAVAQISEQEIGNINIGSQTDVSFVNGSKAVGAVSFISTVSDPATRTFRVEVELPNPDLKIKDGLTTELNLSLPVQKAYQIPAVALTLNEQGQIGIKTVDTNSKVAFQALTIISEDKDGVWALGPQGDIQIITVGQEYVISGEPVTPVMVKAEAE